jgi:lipoprotein-releasing system ATP-binding protein
MEISCYNSTRYDFCSSFNLLAKFMNSAKMDSLLSFKHVCRHFFQGKKAIHVLRDISFNLLKGEIVGLIGASGSGKSTLLHLAGFLDSPSSGEILLKTNTDLSKQSKTTLTESQKRNYRLSHIGFVYQFHYLLPEFSALENIMLPQKILKIPDSISRKTSLELLEKLNIAHRQKHRPSELSGGEQQRVAIARALANKPQLLIADEPTGNLDSNTTLSVFNELLALVKHEGLTALIATHDVSLASKMDRILTLEGGSLCPF